MHSPTSPSALRRKAAAEQRQTATRARETAEGVQPGKRGRPRRSEASAALYNASVRLTPAEYKAAIALAEKRGLCLAQWLRFAATNDAGTAAPAPAQIIERPAKIDREHARTLAGIANNYNQTVHAVNVLTRKLNQGEEVNAAMITAITAMAEAVQEQAKKSAEIEPGLMGKAAKLIGWKR